MLLASVQHGCISLQQALGCGLSRDAVFRRARSGRWTRLLPRVYAVTGAPRTWEQRLVAATLWAGDDAVVAGASAAALWGFPGFGRGPVEVADPSRRRSPRGVVLRRMDVDARDRTNLDEHAVTTAARTLVEVAPRLSRKSFDAAFHHCLHARIATIGGFRDLALRHSGPGRAGGPALREALCAYGDGGRAAASPLEARLARLLHRSALPPSVRQHEVRVGGRRRYLDFAWPDCRVALEADGYRWHSSRSAWESDRARLRELRRAGWTVVQVTHDDVVGGADELVRELAALLAR